MKKIFTLFFAASLLLQLPLLAEDSVSPKTESTSQSQQKAPDFSPPKDLTGPVFPLEEVIGKPSPDTDRFLTEFMNMMATLGLIISLILVFAWFLKRMLNSRQEQANTTSLIKVLERRALSPKTAIYLIEVEGKSIVVAESQNGVTPLIHYDTLDEETPPEIPSAFNKILGQTRSEPK